MTNTTILRVHEDIILTEAQKSNLEALIGPYKISSFSDKRAIAESYIKRADSLLEGFELIVHSHVPDKSQSPELETRILSASRQWRDLFCFQKSNTLEELQKRLARFTHGLASLIMTHWNIPAVEAIEWLNKAEQYQIMLKPAPHLATLTKNPLAHIAPKAAYLLQWDKRLPCNDEALILELQAIKKAKAPATPEWFRHLTRHGFIFQSMLMAHFSKLTLPSDDIKTKIKQDFNQLLLDKINTLDQTKFGQLRELTQDLLQNNEKSEDCYRLSKLPLWYWSLSHEEQHFLGYVLGKAQSIEDLLAFVPSRLRTIPTPANFRAHRFFILNEQAKNTSEPFPERISSSHIASRDLIGKPLEVEVEHAQRNLESVLSCNKDKKPTFIQTLISPTSLSQAVMPDLDLDRRLNETIENSNAEIIYANHALNYVRFWHITWPDNEASKNIIGMADKQLKAKQDSSLQSLKKAYEDLLNSEWGTGTIYDSLGRELLLSSYEQLIACKANGFSYGSCVSGKDRKSLEFIHTDAMILYHHIYKRWPHYRDEPAERKNFVEIVARMYISRHIHELAGQNALGADGIKTPAMYLPSDIYRRIINLMQTENALAEDDRMASNNEVKTIDKSLQKGHVITTIDTYTLQWLASIAGDNTQKFINFLEYYLAPRSFFQATMNYGLWSSRPYQPKGISDFRSVLDQDMSAAEKFQKILQCMETRPRKDDSRKEFTKTLYNNLFDMLDNPVNTNNIIDNMLQQFIVKFPELTHYLEIIDEKFIRIANQFSESDCQELLNALTVLLGEKSYFSEESSQSQLFKDLDCIVRQPGKKKGNTAQQNLIVAHILQKVGNYTKERSTNNLSKMLSCLDDLISEKQSIVPVINRLGELRKEAFNSNRVQIEASSSCTPSC